MADMIWAEVSVILIVVGLLIYVAARSLERAYGLVHRLIDRAGS